MTNKPIVLNAVAPYGADVLAPNGVINIGGGLVTFPYLQIVKDPLPQIQPYVAEVPGVQVCTFTTGNATYSINILSKSLVTNVPKTFTYNIINAAGLTAPQIDAQFIGLINADLSIPITASGTTTLILTAKAGYPLFQTTNNDPTSTVTIVVDGTGGSTLGVVGYGSGAVLALNPTLLDAGIVATNNYTTVTVEYYNLKSRDSDSFSNAINTQVIYINQGDVDYLSLVGTYGNLTLALNGKQVSAPVAMVATGTAAYAQATGIITLATAGTFSSQDIKVGDIIYIDSAPTVPIPVKIETTNLLGVSTIGLNGGVDIAAGAYHIVHM